MTNTTAQLPAYDDTVYGMLEDLVYHYAGYASDKANLATLLADIRTARASIASTDTKTYIRGHFVDRTVL